MLPTASRGLPSSSMSRPNAMLLQYLRRIVKLLLYLPFTDLIFIGLFQTPIRTPNITSVIFVFVNQWARDDPAFAVICSLLLTVATFAYCVAYGHGVSHSIVLVITLLLFHFLILGAILATCCWLLTNAYLREESPNSNVVEQRVEWLYAFDVHCNSFSPLFVLIYVIHYFISPLLVAHGFIPVLLSNLLFMVAASYYHYLNFLGYDVLPFLERTTFFLYPIGVVIVLSPISIEDSIFPDKRLLGDNIRVGALLGLPFFVWLLQVSGN